MEGLKVFKGTRMSGVLRLGALCGVFSMLLFSLGCPPPPPPPETACEVDADCDNELYCDGVETCDVATGDCVDGTAPCDAALCDEDNDVCLDCLEDADCDDGEYCSGTETCGDDGTCVEGTNPCTAPLVCNEDLDDCVDLCAGVDCDDLVDCTDDSCDPATGGCLHEDNCADDGEYCNGTESCDIAANACVSSGNPCDVAAGETCNEGTQTCDVAPVVPEVNLIGCPDEALGAGDTVDLTAEATGFSVGGVLTYTWTVDGPGTIAADEETATFTAAGGSATVTVSVQDNEMTTLDPEPVDPPVDCVDDVDCAANEVCFDDLCSTQGADVPTPVGTPVTADCAITVEFTPALTCSAGSVNPGRSSAGALVSGAPGTMFNNALNGNANQQGVDPEAIATLWTIEGQPAGSGSVSFGNETELESSWTIAPPALAGDYMFKLMATNENTGETCESFVTLNLLAIPTVVVKEDFVPTRLHMVRGSAGRDVDLTYTSDSDGFINIYDGTGNSDANDIMAGVVFTDSDGAAADVTATIAATGDRATQNPQWYGLATQLTDAVGIVPGDTDGDGLVTDNAVVLADGTNTAAVNEQPLILYTSVPFTAAATAAAGGVPPLTELTTEVGEVAGAGTGAGQVAHSGIAGGLAMVGGQQSFVGGVDFNGDDYDDFAVLAGAAAVDVFFGHPGMNTDYAAPGTGDAWPAQPPAANYRGEQVVANVANAIALASGDVNGDHIPDLVILQDGGAAQLQIILGQSGTVTPFANAATAGRFRLYTPGTPATDFLNATVAVGDLTGDGIDDIVVGAPNYDPDQAGALAGVADGGIFVIYGVGALPASGTTLETVAAAPTGRTIPGVGLGTDQRGCVVHIGDWDGSGGMDLAAAYGGTLTAGAIEIFTGSSIFPGAPTKTYDTVANGDMVGGTLMFADVNGTAGMDLLVGAAGAAAGDGLFTIIPAGTADATPINSANTIDYVPAAGSADGLGSALKVFDYDGDGTLDVLVGASGGSYVEVIYGPITGDFTSTGVDQRLNAAAGAAGDTIFMGDVNADGNDDLVITDTANLAAYCMFGLD